VRISRFPFALSLQHFSAIFVPECRCYFN